MKTIRTIGVLAFAVAASGCATIIRGTSQNFTIETTPPGASATLSTGQSCTTPCKLRLPRKQDFDVSIAKDGYDSGTVQVTSGWSRGGTQTFIIGNIILGGLIGMGVDAANGATRDLRPNPLVVTLVPKGTAAPASVEPTSAPQAAALQPAS